MERLNGSIRTYVWAILGAQAQTRSNILKAGTVFDAQRQFLANTEDAIASSVDIPASIACYQERLQYASTPLDFVLGNGLYMAPSDMALHLGSVQGYNNEIVIAGSDPVISHNPGINESELICGTKGDRAFQGKIAPPPETVHRGPQAAKPLLDGMSAAPVATQPAPRSAAELPRKPLQRERANAHEEEKAALITAGITLGLAALWLSSSSRGRRPDGPEPVPSSHEKQCPCSNAHGPHIFCKPTRSLS